MNEAKPDPTLRETDRLAHKVARCVSHIRKNAPNAFRDIDYVEDAYIAVYRASELDRMLDAYEKAEHRAEGEAPA